MTAGGGWLILGAWLSLLAGIWLNEVEWLRRLPNIFELLQNTPAHSVAARTDLWVIHPNEPADVREYRRTQWALGNFAGRFLRG